MGEPDALIKTKVIGHKLEYHYDFSENWGLLLGQAIAKAHPKIIADQPKAAIN